MISKISELFSKAPFPAIMTIISFFAFVRIYFVLITTSVEPKYLEGLIFLVPFACFGIMTFLGAKERYKIASSPVSTCLVIIILGFFMLFALIVISFDTATTETKDAGKYQRVLQLSDYPDNELIKCFPSEIPNNAKDIVFQYNPAFLQGGEVFLLKFATDIESIENYSKEFSLNSKWVGKPNDSEAGENGICTGMFDNLGYTDLPEDFVIYLIDSKAYKPNDWNHGVITLVAISKQRKEIIYFAESW